MQVILFFYSKFALLVVVPDCEPDDEREYTFQANDVLVLGDGTYTELEFGNTDLTLMANASLEIGSERNRGIALSQAMTVGFAEWAHSNGSS